MSRRPIVNMLWIGEQLGRIEQLSIASWLAAGHEVRLHTYGTVKNVPPAVTIANGEATAPFAFMQSLRHKKSGSFALASDYFRYRLQKNGAGLWSDLDVVCLEPVTIEKDVLFGLEDARHINGAVLYLKPDLALADELLSLFSDNYIPPWVRRRDALKLRFKRALGGHLTPADLPWGTYGPRAITKLARKHGLLDAAEPRDVFYPLDFRKARDIYDPAFSLDSLITPRTRTVHLWNEVLGDLKHTMPPAGSPLARLFTQFGV